MDKTDTFIDRITIDHDVMAGKPIIKGTRITVENILALLMQGMSTEEILSEYPHLVKDDIFACLAFARAALQKSTFIPRTH